MTPLAKLKDELENSLEELTALQERRTQAPKDAELQKKLGEAIAKTTKAWIAYKERIDRNLDEARKDHEAFKKELLDEARKGLQ